MPEAVSAVGVPPRPPRRVAAGEWPERQLAWPYLEEALLAVGVAVNLAIALSARHFPYQDSTNHLARYALIARSWAGELPPDVQVRLLPTAYAGVDLLGALLVYTVGPHVTLGVLTTLALTLLPCGMYFLLRAACPARRGWALVGVLFSFSWYFLDGHLNYTLGLGVTLCWLAWWWPRRADASWRRRVLLALGAVGLFLVHLTAPLIVLVVVWVDYFVELLADRTAARGRAALWTPRAATSLLLTVAVGALYVWTEVAGSTAGGGHGEWVFRNPAAKLAVLGVPFFSFSLAQAAVMASSYAFAAAAFVLVNRGVLQVNSLVVSAAVFLLLYLLFPRVMPGAGDVDVRWLPPAYLLIFCASGTTARSRAQRPVLGALLLACVAHGGVVWSRARVIDRELDDFDRVVEQIPPSARVLPLVSDQNRHGRITPYRHYALWHTIEHGGRVPGIFSLTGTRAGDPPNTQFGHFRVLTHLYYPRNDWGTTLFSPLDWRRISEDYDYVIQAGDDPRVRTYLGAHARETLRVGAVTLYEAVAPQSQQHH